MKFTEHTLRFPNDYDGPVVATIVEPESQPQSGKAILYIHGYVDYFFQYHMATRFVEEGYRFYAVDLRKYGRSILPGQHPNFCASVVEYFPDITESLRYIVDRGATELILLGHSTGGLLASLYAESGPLRDVVNKLILNSPFFDFNTSGFKKNFGIPLVAGFGRVLPFMSMKTELSPWYARSIHKDYYGAWDFNTKWKPLSGFPLYFSWLAAIQTAQRHLQAGLQIDLPVLVLSSDHSYQGREWNDEMLRSDVVLNVKDIEKYAHCLGQNSTYQAIENGMHDLALSPQPVREEVFRSMLEWLGT